MSDTPESVQPTEGTATPVAETKPAATPEQSTAEPGTQPNDTEPKEPPREPWFQKRINELTAKYRDEERKRVALEAMLQSRQEKPPEAQPDIDALVTQRAREIAQQQAINDAANRTYESGKAKFADFDTAVNNMRNVADLTQHPHFLEAVTKLPNGADVYYHLGKNLDDAAHVLSLPPVHMGLELARLSATLGKPIQTSKAPPPGTPVGGAVGVSDGLSDDLPIGEWIKRREKQLQSR